MWLDGAQSIMKTQVEWFSKNMPLGQTIHNVKAYHKYSLIKIFMPLNNHRSIKLILASKNSKLTKSKNLKNSNKNMKFWEILTFRKNLPDQVFIKKYFLNHLQYINNLILKKLFLHQVATKSQASERKIWVGKHKYWPCKKNN